MLTGIYKTNIRAAVEVPTYATIMALALTDLNQGQIDWLNWDPDSIRAEFEDISADIPDENFDRIMALQLALNSDEFYYNVATFINICNALGPDGVDFKVFDPADVEEMAWAVTEIGLHDAEMEHFSEEIQIYAGEQLFAEGFSRTPKRLDFAILPAKARLVSDNADIEFAAAFAREDEEIQEVELGVLRKLEDMQNRIDTMQLRYSDATAKTLYSRDINTAAQRISAVEERLSPGQV